MLHFQSDPEAASNRCQRGMMPPIATISLLAAAFASTTAASAYALEETAASTVGKAPDAFGVPDGRLADLPAVSSLPPGLVQISPHIPGMGEHWANPRDLPLGPIYCVMEGRLTCMEFMISQQDFRDGRSFEQLRPWLAEGVLQPPVDHVNLDFTPRGHPGYEIPHYDLHMYFVPAEVLQQDRVARQAER